MAKINITERRLAQIIREEIKNTLNEAYDGDKGYKHQRSREPGPGGFGSVTLPEPSVNASSITMEDPAGFFKSMIKLYNKVGMPEEAAKMQKELDKLAAPMAPDAEPLMDEEEY